MNNLAKFSIRGIGSKVTLAIPSSFSKSTVFNVDSVDFYAKLDLAFYLDNDTKSYLKTIWKKAKDPYYAKPPSLSRWGEDTETTSTNYIDTDTGDA